MDQALVDKWKATDRVLKHLLGPRTYRLFGLARNDPDVNEVISGYDYRTFPKSFRWDEIDLRTGSRTGNIWRREGLTVFNYRVKHGEEPYGTVLLRRKVDIHILTLLCDVEASHMNLREIIDEGIAIQNADRHFSKSCGRAILRVRKYALSRAKRRQRAKVSSEEA